MASTARSGSQVAVVAGGAGFLGSHLAEVLIGQGYHVIVLDNYSTGREENLAGLLGHKNFSFKIGDINKGLPELPRVDLIFHLAGVEEYLNGTDVSVETLLVNSIGTRNLLEMARAHKAKIILASSLDIYSGILSALSMEHYFGISKRDEERFSHHEAKRYAEALTTEYFKKFGVDARIVRLADVYGPRLDLRAGTEIAELLAQALQPAITELKVHGDGLKILHPTYVADAVYGLIKATIGEATKGKIYTLVAPEAQTVLNVASTLRKILPTHPEIKFTTDIKETRFSLHQPELASQKELSWRATVSLEDGLSRSLAYFKTKQEVPTVLKIVTGAAAVATVFPPRQYAASLQPFSAAARIKKVLGLALSRPVARAERIDGRGLATKIIVASAVGLILLTTVIPVVAVLARSGYGAWRLQASRDALLSGNTDLAFASAAAAEEAFSSGAAGVDDLTWLTSILNFRGGAESYRLLLSSAAESAAAAKYLANSGTPLLAVLKNLVQTDVATKPDAVGIREALAATLSNLQVADDHVASAQVKAREIDEANLPPVLTAQYHELLSQLSSVREALVRARTAVRIMPEVLGLNGPRSYLLLFMNNNELRPGGGFIGSYALAKFEGGALRDLQVDDIYNPDGQLPTNITPPDPIKNYLAVKSLGIRDSNFSPDFPTWSKTARQLFAQATGKNVAGVMAVDIRTLENILRVTGPVTVADYGESISADTFFERTQFHADVAFFPGSSAKKDFVGAVARLVLDKVLHGKVETWPKILAALKTSADEKHLLATLDDSDAAKLLAQSNWDGALAAPATSDPNHAGRVEDYLLVVDANLGGNKANYFVKNQMNYQVSADKEGRLSAQLTILYEHTATTETWPSGRYKDYLRVYAPLGSKLTKVEMSDVKDLPTVSTLTEAGRTVFATFFEIPSSTKRTLILTYELPTSLATISKESSYHLVVQKQPGTGETPFSFNFNAPTFLRVVPETGTNTAQYSSRVTTDLRVDRQFNIQVTP